jgi:P pilus assembly chaperone PapD
MKKIFLLIILSNIIFAITLTPLTLTLDSKNKKHMIFTVNNPTSTGVAVTFNILQVLDTNNNKENRVKTDKVSWYPSQFVLSSKSSKSIRVRYMGSKLPEVEEIYRVIAKELDVAISDNKEKDDSIKEVKAKIKMRFSYEGLLFVHKADAIAKLSIDSFEARTNRDISITIVNRGNMSMLPSSRDFDYLVTIKGKEYQLQEEDLKGAEFRRVLTGKTNTFHLKKIINLPLTGKIESIRLKKK